MSIWYQPQGNSAFGKLALAAGAVACVLPLPLFGIHFPGLPSLEKNLLTGLFIVSMGLSSVIGYRRPLLGLLILPLFFFGVMCLACWYLSSR